MQRIHVLMLALASILSVLLMTATWHTMENGNALVLSADNYVTWQRDAANMRAASDYLTDQARSFVYTGNRQYLDNYFIEANVTRRRDNALTNMKEALGAENPSYRALAAAMVESVALMEQEYYAMRLTISAMGYPLQDYPPVIQQVILSPADRALDPARQKTKAVDLLYSESYLERKASINANIDQCLDSIMTDLNETQETVSHRLISSMRFQELLIFLLLLTVLLLTVLTFSLLYRPLGRNMEFIRSKQPVPVTGSSEVRIFASTYNAMFEENQKSQERLSYDATHDILTGLYNRKAYEDILHTLDDTVFLSVALLLIDVDHFKDVNDTFGHVTGDRVLTRVANILKDNFRSDDYVCRIGGDEFAVIMTQVSSSLQEQVRSKVGKINATLLTPDLDLPPTSLSVGVAFGDKSQHVADIFKQADAALYRVKSNGRNGCDFSP